MKHPDKIPKTMLYSRLPLARAAKVGGTEDSGIDELSKEPGDSESTDAEEDRAKVVHLSTEEDAKCKSLMLQCQASYSP